MSTEFISSVPIIPARDIEASASWYRGSPRREFAVTDHDGNLVTFFEPPAGYEPQPG